MQLSWLKNYNLLIFDELDSTNSESHRLIKSGVYGDFVIWAHQQTAGRGQRNRNWVSNPGNLYFSLLLDRNIHITRQPQLSFVSAVALYEAIASLAKKASVHFDMKLKWPNDILINNSKVAGILLESMRFNSRNYLTIGIGVNITSSPNLPDRTTTNLLSEGLVLNDPGELLNAFMVNFDKHFDHWNNQGFLKIRKLWLSKAQNLNQAITVDNGVDRISGIFKDIDLNGNMRLQISSGQICSFGVGDVYFERTSL
jgi:BirA family biotin operon repressor/biotin-[acetyl-CoA-carboxylase] ligase